MSRAYGKKTGREIIAEILGGGEHEATTGELREEGIGENNPTGPYAGDPRDIPGGKPHLANPPVRRYRLDPKPGQDPYTNLNAHGVEPHQAGYIERDARLTGAVNTRARPPLEGEHTRPSPVPVYIVEETGGADTIRTAMPRSVTCPASTSAEPIRVAGLNPRRVRIGLLNEDTSTDIRFSADLSNLSAGTGALLPWPANAYLWLETQGELFAIGSTGAGTPRLSIIEEYQESPAV